MPERGEGPKRHRLWVCARMLRMWRTPPHRRSLTARALGIDKHATSDCYVRQRDERWAREEALARMAAA